MDKKYLKVKFKSSPIFYEKEKSGIKNNTVRIISHEAFEYSEDWRFLHLAEVYKMTEKNNHQLPKDINFIIEIENKETKETFEREIKDITIYENNVEMIFIITWEHKEA